MGKKEIDEFKVSVIIPVHNAGKYIFRAVQSAISLRQTAEVILIDDHSTDDSLKLCEQMVSTSQKIKLVTNQYKKNIGPGAARNLGVGAAVSSFIAFLDADDYFLPNRFEADEEVFRNTATDGVYGFTKCIFDNKELKDKYLIRHSENETFTERIGSDDLLFYLLFGGKGSFHINGITLKKSVFDKVGYFDTSFRLAEDTELWLRLAASCNLQPGNIETPVAIRTVHANNSVHASDEVINHYNTLLFSKLMFWAINQRQLSFQKMNWFFMAYHRSLAQNNSGSLRLLLKLAWQNPNFLLHFFLYRKGLSILKSGFKQLIQKHYDTTTR